MKSIAQHSLAAVAQGLQLRNKNPKRKVAAKLRGGPCDGVRYGYRRVHILLRREGWRINHKRTRRLYHDAGVGNLANALVQGSLVGAAGTIV